jgi:hypothetical protein
MWVAAAMSIHISNRHAPTPPKNPSAVQLHRTPNGVSGVTMSCEIVETRQSCSRTC